MKIQRPVVLVIIEVLNNPTNFFERIIRHFKEIERFGKIFG